MEFFLLVLLLTLVSFSMAVLCYGLTLRFFNGSKLARYILTPLLVVGWDFLVVIQEQTLRWVLGLLPIAVVGILFLLLGFFQAVFLLFCIGLGFYIGYKMDAGEDLVDLLDNLLPPYHK